MACCYTDEVLRFPGPTMFAESVDMCYVLIMEGSSNRPHLIEQLGVHRPAPVVRLQVNKGYKKCHKPNLLRAEIALDLAHSYHRVFTHALESGYRRVLVLEEDVYFDNYETEDIVRLNRFLLENDPEILSLGSLGIKNSLNKDDQPFICDFPTAANVGCTHAVVYSATYMSWFVQPETQALLLSDVVGGHVDQLFLHHRTGPSTCAYHKSIAFQLLDFTENMSNPDTGWATDPQDVLWIKLLSLHKNHWNWCSSTNNLLWVVVLVITGLIVLGAFLFAAVLRSTLGAVLAVSAGVPAAIVCSFSVLTLVKYANREYTCKITPCSLNLERSLPLLKEHVLKLIHKQPSVATKTSSVSEKEITTAIKDQQLIVSPRIAQQLRETITNNKNQDLRLEVFDSHIGGFRVRKLGLPGSLQVVVA